MSKKSYVIVTLQNPDDAGALAMMLSQILDQLASANVLSGEVDMASGHNVESETEIGTHLDKAWSLIEQKVAEQEADKVVDFPAPQLVQ